MSKKLTPSDIVILVAGIVLLIASFLPWVELDVLDRSDNAWEHFPGFLYPAIAGTIAAILVVVGLTGNLRGGGLWGFSWTQIHWVLGAFATLTALAIALDDFEFFGEDTGIDKTIGVWLSLLAAIALLVGAYLRTREPAETPTL